MKINSFQRLAVRSIRTGFFRSDPPPGSTSPYFYRDPSGPLFAESDEVRFSDDPALQRPILERSNVGMGAVTVNREFIDLEIVNPLYRRLRNLEVNSTKRLVTVGPRFQADFGHLSSRELLLISEGKGFSYAREMFRNFSDLAMLIADYHKPLITLISGTGSSIFALSEYSAANESSRINFHDTRRGFIPFGGVSYLLGTLPFKLGSYLALTATEVSGPDLVYSGLIRHWMSKEALKYMEICSESLLEVSERDSRLLIEEHFLTLPDKTWKFKPFIPLIEDCFGYRRIESVIGRLKHYADGSNDRFAAFAKDALLKISMSSPPALELTHELINRTRDNLEIATRRIKSEQPEVWQQMDPHGCWQVGRHGNFMEIVGREILENSLRLEMRASARLLENDVMRKELSARLFNEIQGSDSARIDLSKFSSIPDIDKFFEPLSDPLHDYVYVPRTELSLSQHPKLRKYHPDFDPMTGLDHDPRHMAKEVSRWADDFMKDDRERLAQSLNVKTQGRFTQMVTGSL